MAGGALILGLLAVSVPGASASARSQSSLARPASGHALTFDGRGTDIASAQLPANTFIVATGLTCTAWVRTF